MNNMLRFAHFGGVLRLLVATQVGCRPATTTTG